MAKVYNIRNKKLGKIVGQLDEEAAKKLVESPLGKNKFSLIPVNTAPEPKAAKKAGK